MLREIRSINPRPVKIRSLVLLVAWSGIIALGLAQDKPQQKAAGEGFPDLIGGLKATPGCLGVETAKTESGKNVIFAWFEDKKAVLNWYYSDTHQRAMKMAFPGHQAGKPLKDVPDGTGPIMAVASITLAEKPTPGTTIPFSQISIELYQPITGGLFVGGRFAPDKLKVPGTRDYTPEKK